MANLSVEDILGGLEKLFVTESVVSSRTLSNQFNAPHQKIVGLVKEIRSKIKLKCTKKT